MRLVCNSKMYEQFHRRRLFPQQRPKEFLFRQQQVIAIRQSERRYLRGTQGLTLLNSQEKYRIQMNLLTNQNRLATGPFEHLI